MSHNMTGMRYGLIGVLAFLLMSLFAGESLAIERVTYYHNDAIGSPVAATDASGNVLWREAYAPYGERLLKEAGSKEEVWYTGKQEEAALGVNYFGARWYDPDIGRFMSIDQPGWMLGMSTASIGMPMRIIIHTGL